MDQQYPVTTREDLMKQNNRHALAVVKMMRGLQAFDAAAVDAAFAQWADNRDKAKASLEGLRAAIPFVAMACNECHEDYRVAKQ